MISKKAFSEWLMYYWFKGYAGDWAKVLAIKLQKDLEREVINEINR